MRACMDDLFPEYAPARSNMVDCQVRPNRVTDPRVLEAMRRLPRELFVPAAMAAMAYLDEDIPIGNGRVLMEPLVIARLVQMARGRPGDRALVVGAGTGYGTAVLSACGCAVTALEEDPALIAVAGRLLARFAPAARLIEGKLIHGGAAGAPWDIILIEGAVEAVPPALAGQLAQGGRLVTVLAGRDGTSRAVLGEPAGAAGSPWVKLREVYDCNTALLPSLRPAPAFVF